MIVLVGCSDSGSKETEAEVDWVDKTGQSTVTIEARDNLFVPEHIVVSPGTEIIFENTGRNPHNVLPVEDGDFEQIDVSKLQPKDKSSITLDTSGEVPYYCSLHGTPKAGMRGIIKVQD